MAFGIVTGTASSQRAATKTITPSPRLDGRAVERSCRGQLARVLREPDRQSLLVAEPDHDVERQHAQAGLADEPRHLHGVRHRRQSGDPGRTARGDRTTRPTAVRWSRTRSRSTACSTRSTLRSAQVFAIDAATGTIIWTYTPSYAGEILNNGRAFNPGSGGRLPGVAVGEGKVFFGLQDGRLIALDQTNGQQVWETSVGSYKNNAKVSSAPIYVNGMVLVGDGSGDSGGNSPSIQAFRAANGARIWSWSPIPSPGQPGYKTWTNNGKGGNGSTPLRRRLVLGVPDRRHQPQAC